MTRPAARWAAPGVVVAATLIAFLPVLSNGFIDWDDQANFVNNAAFRGFGWAQLTWMATTFHLGVYQPLAWLMASVEFAIGGSTPWVYHAGSWLVHAATAGLVYRIAVLLLTPRSPHPARVRICAAATALVFAVHPLRVEAVAWASAQGYPLAGAFFAGSVAAYLRAHGANPGVGDASRRRWLAASVALGVLACLAKPIAVTLPAILLLLDWYPLRRLTRRDGTTNHPVSVWIEKLPYAIPAALVAAAAPLARARLGLTGAEPYHPVARAAQALYGLAFYPLKTIAPFGLSVFDPLPSEIDPFEPRFAASAVVVAAVAVGLWIGRRRAPALAAGALAYAILLAPVLGLVPQGNQLTADRYAYFAGAPLALLIGAALLAAWTRVEAKRTLVIARGAVVAGVLVLLGALTWQQAETWRDAGTLWRHAASVDPGSFQAHTNLGLHHLNRGAHDDALREVDEVLRLNPSSATGHFNRGLTLARLGRTDEAIAAYRAGLTINPNDATARSHLAEVLAGRDRFAEAETEYRSAIALTPHPDLFNGLGIMLAEQGRVDEAVAAFREALARDPGHADARANLATALQLLATE
jgi:tetratricopeptide (TPR) repeat protein